MMSKVLSYKLYCFFLLLMILWSQHAWFTWGLDSNKILGYFVYVLFLWITLVYKKKNKISIAFEKKETTALLLFGLGLLLSMDSIKSLPANILIYYPLLIIVSDKKNSTSCLDTLSKIIGIIVAIGIIPYLLWLNDTLSIVGKPIAYDMDYDIFTNYYLFIAAPTAFTGYRYHSVFLEPGYLGTMCALFLYINNYNLKKYYNVFFLVALILSLSLAGYVLAVIGYFLYVGIQKRSIVKALFFVGVIGSIFFFVAQFDDGDSDVNNLIVERLKYDEEKGISGNDRFGENTERLYQQTLNSWDFLFGIDKNTFYASKLEGSGYKIYIIHYGIISYILIWAFYWVMASTSRERKKTLTLCFLLYLCFLKATDPCTYSWLLPFLLYVNKYKQVEIKENTKLVEQKTSN